MKPKFYIGSLITAFTLFLLPAISRAAAPVNDNCAGAISLTSNTTCTTVNTTMDQATTNALAGCVVGAHYDVWYSFVAASTSETVTISTLGVNITNPEVALFGACPAVTQLACGATTFTYNSCTIGNTYYIRVSNVGADPSGNGQKAKFDICVTHPQPPPANDDCAGAVTLTAGAACSNTVGTVISATATAGLPAGCESAGIHYDVWYKFVAVKTYEVITISGNGTNFNNPELQVYSGACGAFTSLQCGTTSMTASPLTIGNTYYIRVSNVGSSPSTNGAFSICVYHPSGASIDYGKSYVNITRNSGGGTINTGDTLEIRSTLVVRSLTLDSIAFFDTLHAAGGVRLVPGSIALRTNEGKVYGTAFTDAFDGDAGYAYVSGTDTVVRINFGLGASNVRRGRLSNTSKPSVFGSTCIIMATYRVVVYAAYNATINVGGGAFTIKDATTGVLSSLNNNVRNAYIYSSPGLCPNAVSASNAIGGDFNGTFGVPATAAPLLKNRGTSTNVLGYTYAAFTTGAPQDYFYGITNNTSGSSTSFSTLNTWAKPDNTVPTHRVFNFWDIIGDHTGATNTAKGNPPCDTTKPVSATNPCGYMLVINSAYKTDTAFQYSVSNLCPNTYYELSAWVRNICYKCSCDSNGVTATTIGYIPTGTNDSSGVQPNLAFDINGSDYYTTGNIVYTGVTQGGSDSTNSWVKRGFTYLTGPAQTSLTLTIRNNAPGGGGNDWALDDITLATCLPNMSYSPSLSPTVCSTNTITINDTVRSYFNNYTYYKWQRSTDGGSTWSDVTGASGPASPTWNGSAWEYVTSYAVPPTATTLANNGDKYRVVVATTSSNLGTSTCLFTDGVSIITVSVIDCTNPLDANLLSFNGKLVNGKGNLSWTTSKENQPLEFSIEKSADGVSFSEISKVTGYNNNSDELNNYVFTDPTPLTVKTWYRLAMLTNGRISKYSRTIQLGTIQQEFAINNLVNPFNNDLQFELSLSENSKIDISLFDMYGKVIKSTTKFVYQGNTSLGLDNLDALAPGIYILRVTNKEKILTRRVVKK